MTGIPRYIATPVNSANNVAAINANFSAIEQAMIDLLTRSGMVPNAMNADFDMNGYNILNQGNPIALTSFNWRNMWITATVYNVGDAVFYNSSSYLCILAHTSTVFITDLLAQKWFNIDLGIKYQGNWVGPGHGYFQGDIVVVSPDSLYVCLVDNISTNSFGNDLSAGKWTAYGGALGTMALQNASAVNITGGTAVLNGTNALSIGNVAGLANIQWSSPTVPGKVFIGFTGNTEVFYIALSADGLGIKMDTTRGVFQDNSNNDICGVPTGVVWPLLGSSSFIPAGWVVLTNGTIGSASSGASIRANADTQDLYTQLWTSFPTCVVSGGKGVSAVADFAANKTLALDDFAARVLAPYGQNPNVTGADMFSLGETFGEQDHTLIINEIPPHTHDTINIPISGGTTYQGGPGYKAVTEESSSTGGGLSHNTMQPTMFATFMVKL